MAEFVHDFIGELEFQSEKVVRSLESKGGSVYAIVDPVTSGFSSFNGVDKLKLQVPIHNARKELKNLDQNGFQLVEHEFQFNDYYNEMEILTKYYDEVANFVKEITSAYKVYCFDHVVRNSGVSTNYSLKDGQKIGGPALTVHGDYAKEGAPVRVANFTKPPCNDDSYLKSHGTRPLIGEEEMNELKGRRYAIINLWRSFTNEPCVDMPLTFCDAATTSPNDYVAIEFRYVDRMIETYLGGYSPQQKWYYFPELLKTEGILIKTYDSQGALWEGMTDYEPFHVNEPSIPATSVLHTAVKDPRLGEVYKGRESIEVRTVVFF